MKFTSQSISDVILIEPNILNDNRGYFVETFRQDLLEKTIGYKVSFKQENESKSSKGTLRGLHYQIEPFAQAKLLSVIKGSVLDVAVDIRKSSPSFGHHVSVELTENSCVDTSSCVAITAVGIIENSFGSELVVYPNPTNGNLSIDLGAFYENSQIVITDISGKLINSKTINQSQTLNLSILEPSGIYIVTIQTGDKKAIIRLVKE